MGAREVVAVNVAENAFGPHLYLSDLFKGKLPRGKGYVGNAYGNTFRKGVGGTYENRVAARMKARYPRRYFVFFSARYGQRKRQNVAHAQFVLSEGVQPRQPYFARRRRVVFFPFGNGFFYVAVGSVIEQRNGVIHAVHACAGDGNIRGVPNDEIIPEGVAQGGNQQPVFLRAVQAVRSADKSVFCKIFFYTLVEGGFSRKVGTGKACQHGKQKGNGGKRHEKARLVRAYIFDRKKEKVA